MFVQCSFPAGAREYIDEESMGSVPKELVYFVVETKTLKKQNKKTQS